MTIPQTTYPSVMPIGIEGQIADTGDDIHCRTRVNTTAAMEFGRGVTRGSADDTVVLPTATIANFAGVTAFSHVGSGDTTSTGIPAKTPANILRKGRVTVVPETAVAPGDPVYMRFQNAGALPEAIGRFRNDNDGGSGDVILLSATLPIAWATTATAGNPAVLELNFP